MKEMRIAPESRIDIFNAPDGGVSVQVHVVDQMVWLTQRSMAELYQTTPQNIGMHLKAIYEEGELDRGATCKEYLQVRTEGNREIKRVVKHYGLDAIIAVGYRVRSSMGTQFRRWATRLLKEYMVKGFALDDERLKNPGGWDYFDELLERIRAIRASEKRFYQKVKDLFAQTSADYDGTSETAVLFFKTIQNKMLFAVTGKTAAQIVMERADAASPNMGLTSFKGDAVRKGDVLTSKNYLSQDEIRSLDRLVVMFLDFAEDRAERRQRVTMQEWIEATDQFLAFNERKVLDNPGKVSHQQAERHAHRQYEVFETARRKQALEQAEIEAEKDFQTLVNEVHAQGKGE